MFIPRGIGVTIDHRMALSSGLFCMDGTLSWSRLMHKGLASRHLWTLHISWHLMREREWERGSDCLGESVFERERERWREGERVRKRATGRKGGKRGRTSRGYLISPSPSLSTHLHWPNFKNDMNFFFFPSHAHQHTHTHAHTALRMWRSWCHFQLISMIVHREVIDGKSKEWGEKVDFIFTYLLT